MPGTPPACRRRPLRGFWCRGCPGPAPPAVLVPVPPRPRLGGFGGSGAGAASEPERVPAARPDGSTRSRPVATAVFWQKPPFSFTFPPAPRWILGEGEAPGPPQAPKHRVLPPNLGVRLRHRRHLPHGFRQRFPSHGRGRGHPKMCPHKNKPGEVLGGPKSHLGGELARLPRPLTRCRYLRCHRSGDSPAGVTLLSAGVSLLVREHPESVPKARVTFGGGAHGSFWGAGRGGLRRCCSGSSPVLAGV